eukprot:7474598-Lingulodinium_polyedra.AAC.1
MQDPVAAATEHPALAWATAVWGRRPPPSLLQAVFAPVAVTRFGLGICPQPHGGHRGLVAKGRLARR